MYTSYISYILLLLLSLIYCKTKDELMKDFVKCANDQVGKEYSEELNSRGPSVFSNAGLVWYCRSVAGFPKTSTIYVNWRDVKRPRVGAYVYGITEERGGSVSADLLGIIVSINPTMVVAGDKEKGVLTKQILKFKKTYKKIEYQFVDF